MICMPQSHEYEAASIPSPAPWYGIRTRSNFEKLATSALLNKGYEAFLPTYNERRQRSDRVVENTVPLFPGYLFCRFNTKNMTPVLSCPGVVSVVGFARQPAAIPDTQIEAVQALLQSGLPVESVGLLQEGQQVRITRGALAGLQGTLLKKKTAWKFVVSVDLLQRSVAVELDPDWITSN
jgi:transcription antitermination factor NusG